MASSSADIIFTDQGPGLSPRQWREAWQRARGKSPLKNSQDNSATQWGRFYDQVSGLYAGVAGHDQRMGGRICGRLLERGLIGPGLSVLDLGCGPGTLALSAARAGSRVVALDCSRPMLAALREQAAGMGLGGLSTICRAWEDHPRGADHDLVLACFFPQALCVSGLLRMETMSRGACALVVSVGRESLPFRRRLWEALLNKPYPRGGFHLKCAAGWLEASGREPEVERLSWPVEFRQPISKILSFYQSYFAIFGIDAYEVERAVRRELAGQCRDEMVTAMGREEAALVWWRAQRQGGRQCATA